MLYVTDAINRLDLFIQEVRNTMPATTTKVAGLFLRLKIQQIKRNGIGSYSPTLYSAHFLKGKELNNLGKTFLDTKIKKKEKTNWAELRKAQGLQIQFVDVYYSGQMIRSTGIISMNNSNYRFYCIIGGRNDEARKKLQANFERYGNFLWPTKDQERQMGKMASEAVAEIYKRILKTA